MTNNTNSISSFKIAHLDWNMDSNQVSSFESTHREVITSDSSKFQIASVNDQLKFPQFFEAKKHTFPKIQKSQFAFKQFARKPKLQIAIIPNPKKRACSEQTYLTPISQKKIKLENETVNLQKLETHCGINHKVLFLNEQRIIFNPEPLNRDTSSVNPSENYSKTNSNDDYSIHSDCDDNSSDYSSDTTLKAKSVLLQQINALATAEKECFIIPSHSDENFFWTARTVESPHSLRGKHIELLTGELTCHTIPFDASEGLRDNLKTAQKITDYVHKSIPFSPNHLIRSRTYALDRGDEYEHHIDEVTRSALHMLRFKTCFDYEPLEFNVNKILKYKVGNCLEMSWLGYSFAKAHAPVEVFSIIDGDHFFLVLGRDKNSDSDDHKNWGPDAVVCDVWTGAYFPASKIEQHLYDYMDMIRINNLWRTQVKLYDPIKQGLLSEILPD